MREVRDNFFGICTYRIQIMKAKVDSDSKRRYITRFLMSSSLSMSGRLHEGSMTAGGQFLRWLLCSFRISSIEIARECFRSPSPSLFLHASSISSTAADLTGFPTHSFFTSSYFHRSRYLSPCLNLWIVSWSTIYLQCCPKLTFVHSDWGKQRAGRRQSTFHVPQWNIYGP